VLNALADIREADLDAAPAEIAPSPVPHALADIPEPPSEEAEPLEGPRVPHALADIPEPEEETAPVDDPPRRDTSRGRRYARPEESEETQREAEEDTVDPDALGEAIESVLASKWYGSGEGPGSQAAGARLAPDRPTALRQVTHETLLAELSAARGTDATVEAEPAPRGSSRMLIIVCVVLGLAAAGFGGMLMLGGKSGIFGSSSSYYRR
jgi:hypothetical protein